MKYSYLDLELELGINLDSGLDAVETHRIWEL